MLPSIFHCFHTVLGLRQSQGLTRRNDVVVLSWHRPPPPTNEEQRATNNCCTTAASGCSTTPSFRHHKSVPPPTKVCLFSVFPSPTAYKPSSYTFRVLSCCSSSTIKLQQNSTQSTTSPLSPWWPSFRSLVHSRLQDWVPSDCRWRTVCLAFISHSIILAHRHFSNIFCRPSVYNLFIPAFRPFSFTVFFTLFFPHPSTSSRTALTTLIPSSPAFDPDRIFISPHAGMDIISPFLVQFAPS